jgi:hypothetical protein
MLKFKLFAVAAFLAFVSCVFLFSSNKIAAQTSKVTNKRDEILEKVASYKIWKQVQKPEKKSDSVEVKPDVLTISESSLAG